MFSVPTLDPEVWQTTEPGTAPPRQRLRALKTLVDAGIKASVGMAPILPGLSDRPEQLAEVVKAVRAAGAASVWANLLYLAPGHEGALPRGAGARLAGGARALRAALRDRAYLPRSEVDPVRERVRDLAREHGIRDRRTDAPRPAARAGSAHAGRLR